MPTSPAYAAPVGLTVRLSNRGCVEQVKVESVAARAVNECINAVSRRTCFAAPVIRAVYLPPRLP
jgi:hypothetical protein